MKLCPTCQVRRGSRVSPASPTKSESDYMDITSPTEHSSHESRRQSVVTSRTSLSMQSPLSTVSGFSSNFQSQNRWMTPVQNHQRPEGLVQPPCYDLSTNTRPIQEDLTSTPNSHHHVFTGGVSYSSRLSSAPSNQAYGTNGLQQMNSQHVSTDLTFFTRSSVKGE